MKTRMLAIGLVAALGSAPCFAQVTAEQLAAAEIRTEKVSDNLYVLFGLGGNIAVSVGPQGSASTARRSTCCTRGPRTRRATPP
jgi:hypothetical protein